MAFRKKFVLSDETLNCYGFWILLSGMDLSGVQANCPLYYEHQTWAIPCGHVENITLEKGKVTGDIVIEGGNEIEKEYIRKIQNGDIKGCSFGIDPIEWSEDAALLKQGQTRATLSKCIPYELSLAPLPGNKNALAMRNKTDLITLSADKTFDFIPDLNPINNMKELAVLLGKPETATEKELMEALRPILLKAANADKMKSVITDKLTVNLSAEAKTFFNSAFERNVDEAMTFLTLAKEVTPAAPVVETVITGAEKKDVKLSDLITPGKDKIALAADPKKTYDYLQKHNSVELNRIKTEEPDLFETLKADYVNGVRHTGKA